MSAASGDKRPELTAKQSRVQTARLAHRIESLDEHRIGLDQAAAGFGGVEIDPERWRKVFDSNDALDIVARSGLTGCYSTFVNNYAELLKTGAYLAGLTPHRRPRTEDAINAVRDNGGLTAEQAERLHELFTFEGRVQHASPDIDASDVRKFVELLRAEATDLIRAAVDWLTSSGVYSPDS